MKVFLALMALIPLTLAACGMGSSNVDVTEAYTFTSPANNPALAIFLTVQNKGGAEDELIGFTINDAERAELHTMTMEGDIMKMRQVDGFEIETDGELVLHPGGNHIMVFGMKPALSAGNTFQATAVFKKAGDVPVTVRVRNPR